MADDHRLGHGNAERHGNDVGGGDLELARAAAHRAMRGEQGGAGDVARSGNDQDLAVAVLVAAGDRGERMAVECGTVERGRLVHRDPVIMSRSAVLGVLASSIGAPWFHSASVGTHSACALGTKS